MKAQSKILLAVALSIAATAVIAFAASRIFAGLQAESARMETLDEILDKTHALQVLTSTFRKEELARSEIHHAKEILASLQGLLRITSRMPREQVLIEQLQTSSTELGPLIDLWFDSGRAETDSDLGRRDLLASQIWMKVQFIADDIDRLLAISQSRVLAAQRKTAATIVALIALLALTNAAIYWFSTRSIMRSQRALEENQKRLRASEERFNLAVRSAGVGIWDHDIGSGKVYFSPRWKTLFGYEEQEIGESVEDWARLLHPEDKKRILKLQEDFLAGTGSTLTAEYRLRHKDGSYRWIQAQGLVVRDENGNARRFVGSHGDITDRKQAEVALRESREQFRLLYEKAPMGIARIDSNTGRFLLINPTYCEILQRTEVEALQLDFQTLTHPDDIAQDLENMRRLREGLCRSFQMDKRYLRPDGSIVWVTLTVVPEWAEGEPPSAHIAMVADITARKSAEEALRRSEARWNAALESFAEGAIIATESEDVVYWNPAAQQMHGFRSPGEGIEPLADMPKTFELWTPDRTHLLGLDEWPMKRIKRGETVHNLELRVRRVDQGWERLFSYSGTMVETAGGERLIFLSVHDVTEQRRAEQALRESEEQFRTLADSIPSIAWWANADGQITWYNRRSQEFTGKTTAEMQGSGWQSVHDPEMLPKVMERWEASIRTSEPFQMEFPLRGADGQYRWFLSRVVPVKDAAGRVTRWFGVNTDITEQKSFQAELERLVAERTARLQDLVGELEHFSYTITHDLKSPLRAMRGFAEMAIEAGDLGEAKPLLEKISSAAERMDGLIADALNYSRSVRQELPLEDVDAGALLRGILDSYPQFQPWKAHIRVQGALPVVLANQAGLTQVFSNLLGNAVKFVKRGEMPDIRVWAALREGWVRIWVEDKGIGISKEMLPRVFDMFSRGSKEYEGTGIGLALVRKVLQRMGGKAGVESEEGKWSRFWFDLKLGEAGLPSPAQVMNTGLNGAEGTVLYVEDEEGDALFMGRAFAQKGLAGNLQVVGDGRAAIDYLSGSGKYADRQKHPVPALVLLDLNLPQVSGFGVLEWMRNSPDYARMPVIVFSSSTRADDRVKAKELGADEFVAKPSSGLQFGEIVEALQRRWLGDKRA